MKILIAEDDLTSRTALAGVLKMHGYKVEETSSGAEAWLALQQPDAPAAHPFLKSTRFLTSR